MQKVMPKNYYQHELTQMLVTETPFSIIAILFVRVVGEFLSWYAHYSEHNYHRDQLVRDSMQKFPRLQILTDI